MPLQMTRPTRHPKSGTFRVRQAIPMELRDAAHRLYGCRAEFIENLATADAGEAKRRAPAALVRLAVKMTAIRHAAAGSPPNLTERDVQALGGLHYHALMAAHGDDPGQPESWDAAASALIDQRPQIDGDADADRPLVASQAQVDFARNALAAAGLPTDPDAVSRVVEARWQADLQATVDLETRANGDWSPSAAAARYPSPRPRQEARAVCTVDTLLLGWATDHGFSLEAKPIDRAVYDRKRTLERLAVFVGHRDASSVTKADVVRWKTEAQTRGLAAATIRNDLSEMSAVWRWGVANDLPLPHGNPFVGLLPPKPKRQAGKRRAFTDAEAAQILNAARAETGLLRWLPWVCALTGARLAELSQSKREDVSIVDGIPVLRIHDDGPDRSLKTAESLRNVPLHPALIAEGFAAYVAALPSGSPMFPDAEIDAMFGRRSATAGKRVSRWLKQSVGITDEAVSPNHSWRHWFIDACRRTQMHTETRSALTGHAARADESAGYGAGMGSFIAVLADALAKVKLPPGVEHRYERRPRTDPSDSQVCL